MANEFYIEENANVTLRGLSPAIWAQIMRQLETDPSRVGFFFDDFENHPALADGDATKYAVALSTSCTFQQYSVQNFADGEFGIARLNHDGTSNDVAGFGSGGNTGGVLKIDDAVAEARVVAFECRVRINTITDGDMSSFFGLTEEGVISATGLIGDDDSFADVDYLGFVIKQADGDQIERVFHKSGGTEDTEDCSTTPAVDTWYKLGFLYDPNAPSGQKIRFFVNGVEDAGLRVTAANLADDTNFPAGEELAMAILSKAADNIASDDHIDVDWVAYGATLDAS